MNKLETLERAIQRLRDYELVNSEVMDAEDLGELQVTIKELVKMKLEEDVKAYRKQVIDFKNYLNDMPEYNSDKWDEWCATPYVITHGEKSVMIENGATMYESIVQLLDDHLEEID